ncbi:MAG TPA: hypothetical protein VHY37_01455 [Tepidisphaeraceae bacterium]|jgi:hypothetical protein|nr:hypothetical protein [Tepidisphaeraceae bacterium]
MPDATPAPLTISPPTVPPRARWRIWLARAIAVAADILEIAIFPAFIPGAASPVTDVVDIAVAILLTVLVGWHVAFVPSFVIKLLPFADLAPTWTVAIALATWPKKSPAK